MKHPIFNHSFHPNPLDCVDVPTGDGAATELVWGTPCLNTCAKDKTMGKKQN